MGGCCCSSRRAESERAPICYHCPQNLEEHEPLSTTHGTSAVSAGMIFDTNLDTSIPDTYRAPPAPLPFDADFSCSQTLPGDYETTANKTDEAQPDSLPVEGTVVSDRFEGSDVCGDLKESECKKKTDYEDDSMKTQKDELSKLEKPITSGTGEEDVCPTCLEEYDLENPRIITKCEHHFHLSCILEWLERSDTCPICDQIMMFDHGFIE